MITQLTLRNFKSIKEQTYKFTSFDLLVGRNNSGKSTVLQALAIWQFCIDEFSRSTRTGTRGIQIVLPNFTTLPVPEFSLLWRERTDRQYPKVGDKKKQEYILIEIEVTWRATDHKEYSFGVKLRYNSPQVIYVIPLEGWNHFRELQENNKLPIIVYVPPFSGLEDIEEWRDDGLMRQQIGKAQPGRVLRNLLLRVWEKRQDDWAKIKQVVKDWFSVDLHDPKYKHGVDTRIICEYKQGDKSYDIIAGGSGFHQTLTLLAFMYGYKPTTILLDEPDAHLHVNLQREVLNYFKIFSNTFEISSQFLIATHAEEFIRKVEVNQIYSFLYQNKIPHREEYTPKIIKAMSDVSNLEVTQLLESPMMLYVEGESDERLLKAWAELLSEDEQESIKKVCFHFMRGGSKKAMKDYATQHFEGVRQIIPQAERLMLFDYDNDESAFHPDLNTVSLHEWKRKNIENYLLVPEAWVRAVLQAQNQPDDLFTQPVKQLIHDFFLNENLTLPRGQSWREVKANIFQVVDGKKLLFEQETSLFQQLQEKLAIQMTRDTVARNMTAEEIHQDVYDFFTKLNRQLAKLKQEL